MCIGLDECGRGGGFIWEWFSLFRGEKRGNFGDGGAEGVMPGASFFEFGFEFSFEFLADVGATRPFPEFVFERFFIPGGEESEAFFFNGDAAGVKVAAAEGNDVGGDLAEVAEVGFGLIVSGGEGVGGGGEAEGEPLNEFVGETGGGAGGGGFGIGEVFGGEGEGVLAILPKAEAVLGPLVEVLFGNGDASEVGSDMGLDFGERIEPGKDAVVALGVLEAAVELFTDGFGEVSDFAVHNFDYLVFGMEA
jgi:hypothetical protein